MKYYQHKEKEIVCKNCGRTFILPVKRKYCDECRDMINAQNRRNAVKKYKSKPLRKKEKISETELLRHEIAELEAYNKAHGTCFTYGQYKNLKG